MPALEEKTDYLGTELAVFTHATNWRAYWQSAMRPYLGSRVLEVGAGIGTITKDLCGAGIRQWVALEPDAKMADGLERDRAGGALPAQCEPRCGGLAVLSDEERFDSILYIDVLEHIEQDRDEVRHARDHLAPGGHLIILVPAHQALYSPFDAAIGHFRRYGRRRLLDLCPPGLALVRARYLDSVGLLASLGNKLLLAQSNPSLKQILLWDRAMVPLSRAIDPLSGFHLGKSLLVVWRKPS